MAAPLYPKPVFAQQPRVSPGFIDKVLGRRPAVNAMIDLSNMLSHRPVLQITEQDIQNISKHYKIDLYKKFSTNLRQLYADFLAYCLSDNQLSDKEILELKKLKSLLSLRDNDIESIHNEVAGQIYSKSFAEALADGRLEQHEKDFLEKLEQELRLPQQLVEKISADLRKSYLAEFVNKIQEDYRVSPEELKELDEISKSLNMEVAIDAKSRATLDRMKWYWVIENGELPVIDVNVTLQSDELCYYKTNTKRNDQKANHKGTHDDTVDGVKIMKGLPYKVGSATVEKLKAEELQMIDAGTLYVTNKRLLFTDGKNNVTIRFDKILSVTPYSDGIGIAIRDVEKPIVFIVTYNADVLAMMVSRKLNDS